MPLSQCSLFASRRWGGFLTSAGSGKQSKTRAKKQSQNPANSRVELSVLWKLKEKNQMKEAAFFHEFGCLGSALCD